MVFPVVGGTQDTGYEIDNSLRFNYSDSPQLSFTPSSDGNKRVATASFWLKRGVSRASNDLHIMGSQEDGSNLYSIRIRSSGNADVFQFLNAVSGSTSNGFTYKTTGGASFRDHSAWYHFVVAMDVTQSDGNNGLKLYVNGVLQDTYSISNYNQNVDVSFNTSGEAMKIGIKSDDSEPFDGYLADFHWIDGTQKQASDFGEYNDNGVWIPKKYDGSYGTNGFYLEFKQTGTSQNSSGIGADTSGNDNHFAVSNLAAIDVTVDTPTNNFATWNSLRPEQDATLSEGNTYVTGVTGGSNSESYHQLGTIVVNKGKWYWEMKVTASDAVNGNIYIGVGHWDFKNTTHGTTSASSIVVSATTTYIGGGTDGNGSTAQSSLAGFDQNDILGVALSCDDEEVQFYKNGSAYGSAVDYSSLSAMQKDVTPYAGHGGSGETNNIYLNCGNPAFSISSGNSDANGYGNFEYAVPSGYYALCTKNLAEYG